MVQLPNGRTPGSPSNPFLPGLGIGAISQAHRLVQEVNNQIAKAASDASAQGVPSSMIPAHPQYDRPMTVDEANQRIKAYYNSLPAKNNVDEVLKKLYEETLDDNKSAPKPPVVPIAAHYDTAKANALINDYVKQLSAAAVTYSISSPISDIQKQLKSAGIKTFPPVPKQTTYTDEKSATAALTAYTQAAQKLLNGVSSQKVAPAATVYDISANLKSVQNQLKVYKVAAPPMPVTKYSTQAAAQKALDLYVAKSNAALQKAGKSTTAKQAVQTTTYSIASNIKQIQQQLKTYKVVFPPAPKTLTFSSQSAAQSALNLYISQSNAALKKAGKATTATKQTTTQYYDVDSSLKSIYNAFISKGGSKSSLSLPSYKTSITSKSQADKIISDYLAKANKALPAAKSTSASAIGTGPKVTMAPGRYGSEFGMTLSQYNQFVKDNTGKAASDTESPGDWMARVYEQAHPLPTNIDPARTSGYKFVSQLNSAQKAGMLEYFERYDKTGMDEYQYRAKFGLDLRTTSGTYVPVTYGSYGHSVNTAPIGSGDIKLAAQSKQIINSNGSTGKATLVAAATPVTQVKLSPGTSALVKLQNLQKIYEAQNPGTVITKQGTVIKQVVAVGNKSSGVSKQYTVPTLEAADVTKQQASLQYQEKLAGTWKPAAIEDKVMVQKEEAAAQALRAQNELLANYKAPLDASGRKINPIQAQGSAGTGTADVRVIDTYDDGRIRAISGNADYYTEAAKQLAAQQALITPSSERTEAKMNMDLKASSAEMGFKEHNLELQKSDNIIVSSLAKLEAMTDPYIDNIGTSIVKALEPETRMGQIAQKAAKGQTLTEREYKDLQKYTGIGTKQEYSKFTRTVDDLFSDKGVNVAGFPISLSTVVPNVKIPILNWQTDSESIGKSVAYLESLAWTGATKAEKALIFPQVNSAASKLISNGVDALEHVNVGSKGQPLLVMGGTNEFTKNTIDSFVNLPKILPAAAISLNKSPQLIASALKESEFLIRNPGNIAPTAAYGTVGMASGMTVNFNKDPAGTALSFYLQGKEIELALKTLNDMGKVASLGGSLTGIVDRSTKLVEANPMKTDLIPLRSKGALIDILKSGEEISGSRAIPLSAGDAIRLNIPSSPGETINGIPIASTKGVMFSPDVGSTSVVGKGFLTDAFNFNKNKVGTLKSLEMLGKQTASAIKSNNPYALNDLMKTMSDRAAFKVSPRLTARVLKVKGIQTVKLPTELEKSILTSIKEKGNFVEHYSKWEKLAQEKANSTGRPVAIPAPKAASGYLEQESEFTVIFPKDANMVSKLDRFGNSTYYKIANKNFGGLTKEGYPVLNVGFGEMKKPLSALESLGKNIKYNTSIGVDKYGVFNKNDQFAANLIAIERDSQLNGKSTYYEGSFETGKHGVEHTTNVQANIQSLKLLNDLAADNTYLSDLGKYHDITKIGAHDQPYGGPHAVSGARAIKSGQIPSLVGKDLKYLQSLADDIAKHTEIKPLNIRNPVSGLKTSVLSRPSIEAKALANADRMDLTRFDMKVDESKLFRLNGSTIGDINKSLRLAETAVRESRLMTDASAELLPIKQVKSFHGYEFSDISNGGYAKSLSKLEGLSKYNLGESEYGLKAARSGVKLSTAGKYAISKSDRGVKPSGTAVNYNTGKSDRRVTPNTSRYVNSVKESSYTFAESVRQLNKLSDSYIYENAERGSKVTAYGYNGKGEYHPVTYNPKTGKYQYTPGKYQSVSGQYSAAKPYKAGSSPYKTSKGSYSATKADYSAKSGSYTPTKIKSNPYGTPGKGTNTLPPSQQPVKYKKNEYMKDQLAKKILNEQKTMMRLIGNKLGLSYLI
jgi:hypothetical protein